MRVVFAFFDTLNRRSLECYGGNSVKTPNFLRLAESSVTFDNHYVGSLPCMPARREMMTGRYNFLHRSWGPCEPYDRTLPEILSKKKQVYSHLVTDHSHYWKDGGATYHSRYDSYEFIRGQEMDPWKGVVDPPFQEWKKLFHKIQFDTKSRSKFRRNMINRFYTSDYNDYPTVKTVSYGLDFIKTNKTADNWFLQIECFDPHEPFTVPESFRDGYPTNYHGPILDYPPYGNFSGSSEEKDELNANYAATLAHCDYQLGRILDVFDKEKLWQDTALLVTTDHGFLLGEHDLWSKNVMPVFNEVAKIPLFISLPENESQSGTRRQALTQTTDLMPTILDFFDLQPPSETLGISLLSILQNDNRGHDAILFGHHGAAINITDGDYVYMRYPSNIFDGNLFQYTLMPTHIMSMFSVEELKRVTLSPPFDFTQGIPLMKVPVIPESPFFKRHGPGSLQDYDTRLYDLTSDQYQTSFIKNERVEKKLTHKMVELMKINDAPSELFDRFNLTL